MDFWLGLGSVEPTCALVGSTERLVGTQFKKKTNNIAVILQIKLISQPKFSSFRQRSLKNKSKVTNKYNGTLYFH